MIVVLWLYQFYSTGREEIFFPFFNDIHLINSYHACEM